MKSSRTHLFTLSIGVALLLGATSLAAQRIAFEAPADIRLQLQRAQDQQKLLFVYFDADWCTGCAQMEAQAFQDAQVASRYNAAFVNARYNQQSPFGEVAAERFGVKSSPTFLFIDPATAQVVHRVVGIASTAALLNIAEIAQDPNENLQAYIQRYEAGQRDATFLYDFAYKVKRANLERSYLDLPDEYLSTQSSWQTPDNLQFIIDFTDRPNMNTFALLASNRSVFYASYSQQAIDQQIDDIVSKRLTELQSLRQTSLQEEIFDKVHELLQVAYPDNAQERTYEFKMSYFKNNTDREGYAQAAIDYVEFMGKDIPPAKLREMAFQFYHYIEDKDLLKHAYKWSKRALRAEKSVRNYDAICSVSYKLDRKFAMRRYIRRGIRYAKLNGEPYDALNEIKRWARDDK